MEATQPPARTPPPPPPAPQIPQDPFSEDLLNIDTSYTPHHHHYSTTTLDFSPPSPLPSSSASSIRSTSPSSARSSLPSSSSRSSFAATATAIPMTITRPTPAYTSSPYVFERNPDLPMPAPYEELTPPPSPQQCSSAKSTTGSSNASFYSASAAVGSKIAPLLNRAGSVLGSTSPKRVSVPSFASSSSPARTSTIFTTPASSRPGSPSKSNMHNNSTATTMPEKKAKAKPMSATFADIFTVKGTSAPMSFGLVQTSPKRETLPSGAVFGPPLSVVEGHGPSGRSSRTASPKRPGHSRHGSTFASTAASLLGLSVPARQVGVGGSGEGWTEAEEGNRDEVLELNLEKELGLTEGVKDVDTLLANASILFSKMQGAYRARRTELVEARREGAAAEEELAEQCTRAKHLKRQLGTLAERVEEGEAEAASLRAELEERNSRARTIRMVDASPDVGIPSERLFSTGSVAPECSDASSSSDEEGRNSAEEQEAYSRPSSASSATSAEADVAGMPWRSSVVPFLPPGEKVREENEALKKRIGELEEIVNGCLGLVDA